MNNTLQIKLLSDNATMPKREHDTDAGFDIYAAETVVLEPQQKAVIATDIAVNIPKGYVGLLTSRSGVSSKTHLVIETGKIDAGYQGHMRINIKNDSQRNVATNNLAFGKYLDIEGEKITDTHSILGDTYRVSKGDKLAQLVIVPIITPELEQVEEFTSESARGEKGFGSSGY
ncbi:dUTP pyrophosphatase [Staphylococcus pseudintermedius]|uniref:dUTP diphosphatase n=1 Tax=Staphylococcus pseudintermedius TaxID=283734 RepID=UPI0019DE5FBD|nr:dUTP pyrophosphatase [Staphylococcus pseudintermedius]EGQ3902559.1 dUTP pyrophosphatase [Staphylococcus pseudintermedius]EHP0513624.1 dUTP pyrophosphatase [Staphylococcus pseudintermedius]EJG5860334.1 dUTP pyrophosphatase [Staphylococcus pseudintermedius]ELJ9082702.1 dUTP pyrophosphatase [Staphylococcus pseudintermedius]MCE5778140.1 dUTP pyrophosphatase [Staphylococcus pseudintermedius]